MFEGNEKITTRRVGIRKPKNRALIPIVGCQQAMGRYSILKT